MKLRLPGLKKMAVGASIFLGLLGVKSEAVWDVATVDSANNVGWYASLALDGGGHPMISYYDYSNNDLKYAYHNGTSWTLQTLDNAGGAGTSIACDSNNRPHIAYHNNSGEVRYIHWTGSVWSASEVVASGISPTFPSPSLALDPNQRPSIAYVVGSGSPGTLTYSHYNGVAWESPASINSSQENQLAFDGSGSAHIAQYTGGKRVGYLNGPSWTANNPTGQTGNLGAFIALSMDGANHPHISFCDTLINASGHDDDLKYCYYNGSSWDAPLTVDTDGVVGWHTSIKTDSANQPHISYHDHTRWLLKYATKSTGTWTNQIVDANGGVGYCTSLALDAGNHPCIAYYDITNKDLKCARWVPGLYQVSGVVRDETNAPKAGVYLFLTSGSVHANTVTQSDGSYSFTNIPAGSCSIVPLLAGWSFSPTQFSWDLSGDQNHQNFVILPGSGKFIRGYITDSLGRQIGQNVLVSLSGASVGNYTTTTTGYYEFVNLISGAYTVTPSLNGYEFTPANRTYAGLNADMDEQGFTGVIQGEVYTIQGSIRDSRGSAVPQITLEAQGATFTAAATTGADGNYTFLGLPYGDYTVRPITAGWVYHPMQLSLAQLGESKTDQNFAAVIGEAFPQELKLIGNLFRPNRGEHASIWYTLSTAGAVTIKLYTLDGLWVRTLVDGQRPSGLNHEIWNGTNADNQVVASGIYLADIRLPNIRQIKKICVLK